MKKYKKKNLKPTNIDANFRYVCPNPDCGYDHWISLREAKTSKFKIVCDCNTVFQPKEILSIKIVYKKTKKIESTKESISEQPKISLVFLEKCVKLLTQYGFTQKESIDLTKIGFLKNPSNQPTEIVRYILQNIGELLNESAKTTSKL